MKTGFDTFMEAELRDPVVKANYDKQRALIAQRDARMRTRVRWESIRVYACGDEAVATVLIGQAHPGALIVMTGMRFSGEGAPRRWEIRVFHNHVINRNVVCGVEQAKRWARGICIAMGLLK